jgi:DNA-binding NarL/FixJ family response regulator
LSGGTLAVSRAVKLFPYYKKCLEDTGFEDVEITGEEKDSLNTVINELKPRLVLMGSGFYHAGTPYMIGQHLRRFPKLNIAAVSLGEFPDSLAVWLIWRGAKSYVNLWEGYEEFRYGLREVRAGKPYISPGVQKLIDRFPEWPETKDKVTKRDREVLTMLCDGYLPEDIGSSLHITRNTVNGDLKKMYRMFHVNNREGMAALAWELGLVTKKDMFFYRRKRDDNRPLPEWAAVKLKMDRMNNEK